MKTFAELLSEAKDRFFLKNKNLNHEQQQELITFTKKYKNFEKLVNKEIGWHKVSKTTYDTFQDLMIRAKDTNSQKKKKAKKLRHKGISGLVEGEDYINIKMKNPYYLAYLPLHYKAAQVLKTEHIGGCVHDGCIGSSKAALWFKREGKQKKRVPVYVIGQGEKYVVMMYPDNQYAWETWRKENKLGESGEIIPDFSIKKELATSKLMDLYKDVLYNKWMRKHKKPPGVGDEDYDDAVEAYDDMLEGVENHFNTRIAALEDHNEHNDETYKSIIESLKESIEEFKNERDIIIQSNSKISDKIKEIKRIIKVEPTGTGINSDGEVVWNLRGIDYTLDDLHDLFKDTEQKLKNPSNLYDESISDIEGSIKEYEKILEEVEEYGGYSWDFDEYAQDHLEYDGFDDIWQETYMFDDVHVHMNFEDSDYDLYFDYILKYTDTGDEIDRSDLNDSLYDNEGDIVHDGAFDGEEWLDDGGVVHPEDIEIS